MSHVSSAAKADKIADSTRFAVIGRAIADAARQRQPHAHLIAELATLRAIEQNCNDREIAFAGLARQLGDAASVGKDTAPLVARLAALRKQELG
jgi:hypothetical protein